MRLRARIVGTALGIATLALAPSAMAKGFAFVTGGGPNGMVASHSVDGSGALSLITTAATGNTPRSVTVTPDARRLYVTNTGDGGSVSAFDIGASGGLTPIGGPVAAGAGAEGGAITPNGQFLYVANTGANTISGYAIDPGSGALTPATGSPYAAANVNAVAISPEGRRLYATTDTGVQAYDIGGGGALTANGAAVSADNPRAIAVRPDSRFLYTANTGSNNVSAFAIGEDGGLTSVETRPAGPNPFGLAVTPQGDFLHTANFNAPGTVNAFTIASGGGLTPVTGQPFHTLSNFSYAADDAPNGRLYVANFVDAAQPGTVSVFTRASSGALSQIAGSPFNAGVNGPEFQSIALTPNQGPTALFSATPQGAKTILFDGSGSTDTDGGAVATYDWEFGDGVTLLDGGPTVSHAYEKPGVYEVTLTVTDDEGCSTTLVFTGQVVDCNGTGGARTAQTIDVTSGTPALRLRAQKLQELRRVVVVKAKTGEVSEVVARGNLLIKSNRGRTALKSFKLKKDSKTVRVGKKAKLKPRLRNKAFRQAKKALNDGGRVTAKVSVKATDADDDTDKEKVKVKLVRPGRR